jgi:hypothetical protein
MRAKHTWKDHPLVKLNLKWKIIDSDRVALLFDKPTFAAFQIVADARGVETTGRVRPTTRLTRRGGRV